METLDAIYSRKSIRQYTDQPVSEENIHAILKAAMSAPSAHNQHPWHFVIIKDHDILVNISQHMTFGKMLAHAPLAILLCCDTNNLRNAAFWPQDMSAATQNMLIASCSLELGAVWVGVYPEEPSVKLLTDLFHLPAGIVPFSLVSIGHPDEHPIIKDRFIDKLVHHNTR